MLGKVLAGDISELIAEKQFDELKRALCELDVPSLAEIVDELDAEKAVVVFRLLPREQAGEVFAALPMPEQTTLLEALSNENVAVVLEGMPPDDRTRLLEEFPGAATQKLIAQLSPEQRRVAQRLLGYKENSIGRLMTPNYIMVQPSQTVAEALDHVRRYYRTAETANVLYVVDEKLRLLDDVRLGQVVAANPDQYIGELIDHNFVALRADDDQEVAVAAFRKHYRVALPVTDSTGVLVGIVTLDDVLSVAEEEATEDIHRIGGMEALDEPYIATPFWTLIKKRAGWLLILFLGEMLTATAMGRFEAEINRAVVLALFIPLIISSGGNSGSQAASLIIRALAVGEVTVRDWWRIMRRELLGGLVLGMALGMVGFLRISIWSAFSDIYGPNWLLVAFTIWASLVGVVIWGTLSGSMLPLLLKRVGLDPAVSSAPFVATLVDVTGIVIYFEVAAFILKGTLL
ncbi:magnesium transporter [bacterium]|nr:magnesium transporter [bacterium]